MPPKKEDVTIEEMITKGDVGYCYICKEVFDRIRITGRFCSHCDKWFCAEEHGSYSGGRIAFCLMHHTKLKKQANEK